MNASVVITCCDYLINGLFACLNGIVTACDVFRGKGLAVISRVLGGEIESVDLLQFGGDIGRDPVFRELVPEEDQPVEVVCCEDICDLMPVVIGNRNVFIDEMFQESLTSVLGNCSDGIGCYSVFPEFAEESVVIKRKVVIGSQLHMLNPSFFMLEK